MAGNMRRQLLERELRATAESAPVPPIGVRGRFASLHLSPVYFLSAALFSLVVVLPVSWGVKPLPYQLGQIAKGDILSRVNFEWRDTEEENRRVGEIKKNYAYRYNQVDRYEWVLQVSGPLWHLIEQADRAKDATQLLEYAKNKNIEITPKQAETLVTELKNKRDWLDLTSDIVAPLQRVLREKIHGRGLLDDDRFAEERGRNIKIISQLGDSDTVRVTGGQRGPMETRQLREVLDEALGQQMQRMGLDFRSALRDILLKRITPTLLLDAKGSAEELNALLEEVRERINEVRAGELLLERGKTITPDLMRKLRAEEEVYRTRRGWQPQAWTFFGKLLLMLTLSLGFSAYVCAGVGDETARERVFQCVLPLAATLLLTANLLIYAGLPTTLMPAGLLAGAAMVALGSRLAALAVAFLGLCLLVLTEGAPGDTLALLAGGWIFAFAARTARHRLSLLGAGLLAGLAAAGVALAWGMASGQATGEASLAGLLKEETRGTAVYGAAGGMIGWLCSGLALLLALRLVERLFSATSNITLQDLQDQEQPALRQLVMQAPGTYHHSVIVGTLAEAGAEAVGANPLLARVGGYYHDIGKVMKPEYFSENETGVSRHDSLSPSMSSLVIISHVKDGAEMAREYGLPAPIVDIISQHHGTGLVTYFHHRALRQARDDEEVSESVFRYPGPAPRGPEAALVMLADSVEAASRALDKPSPAHIRARVREIFLNRLSDRQLDRSGLNLTDLARVEDAFVRILASMFHSRVKYPGDRTPPGKAPRGRTETK